MSRELLQQALDALDNPMIKTHSALREQIRAALAQPAPEPVAWAMPRADGLILDVICPDERDAYQGKYTVPLYAAPQQAQPTENPWKDAVLDRLASASIDAPTDEFPSRILDRIIEVEIMIAKELTPAPAPAGWVMVPDYRGYAALGTGQYLLDISGDANPAELIIHIATGEEKDGRTVGDLRDKSNPGEMIQPEKMAVRLAFFTVAGLDALEQQLRILRETHFAAAPAAPAVQPLSDEQIWMLATQCTIGGDPHIDKFARAIEAHHGIKGSKP